MNGIVFFGASVLKHLSILLREEEGSRLISIILMLVALGSPPGIQGKEQV